EPSPPTTSASRPPDAARRPASHPGGRARSVCCQTPLYRLPRPPTSRLRGKRRSGRLLARVEEHATARTSADAARRSPRARGGGGYGKDGRGSNTAVSSRAWRRRLRQGRPWEQHGGLLARVEEEQGQVLGGVEDAARRLCGAFSNARTRAMTRTA